MNTFLCALRPTGEAIHKSELFAFLARMPRDVEVHSIVEGPFAGIAAAPHRTLRPLLGRYRQLIGAGDVRLDNRAEVLRLAGGACETASDLQLVLAAIDARGADVVARLTGDFAFVAWDARAQKVIAARDTFGVKSLFMRRRNGLLLFSSRAAPLAAEDEYDTDYMRDFLYRASAPTSATVWKDVTRIEPATMLVQRGTGATVTRYWSAARFEAAADGDEAEAVSGFRDLFTRAVTERLEPGSATWSQLSGGLDSSAIVSTAEGLVRAGSIASTVTLVDTLGDGDERHFRNLVLDQYGVKNNEVQDAWPWQDAEHALVPTDEPHPLFPFRSRDERMRSAMIDRGGRVMLSGLGSDHYLFGNLAYIPDLILAGKVMRAARDLAGWSLAARESFWTMARRHAIDPLVGRSLGRTSGGSDAMVFPAWLGGPVEVRRNLDRLYDHVVRPRRGHMFAHHTARELQGVSAWVSRDGFENGMEVRYPFLSRSLVEFALQLPVHMRIRPFARKWVLREAMRGVLPEPIRTRQSKGGIDARILWSFQHENALLQRLLRQPMLADLGLIDASALRTAVEQARCGIRHNLVMLMSALSLETWLSVREGRLAHLEKAA